MTTDIRNFWNAYDKIATTKDSSQQYHYLNTLFIEKGTPGLKAMMNARRYTAKSYIDAINEYPRFWNSVRANTLRVDRFGKAIAANVRKLKRIYPELQPAQIYFTIGALKSGGTTQGKMILIGSELTLAGENTVTEELPPAYASTVVSVQPFKNNTDNVSPAEKQITIEFSVAMDKGYRNFELGPLGKDNLLKIKKVVGFSDDGRLFTFEAELLPDRQYQLVIGSGFRSRDGAQLKPYLIDFKTADR